MLAWIHSWAPWDRTLLAAWGFPISSLPRWPPRTEICYIFWPLGVTQGPEILWKAYSAIFLGSQISTAIVHLHILQQKVLETSLATSTVTIMITWYIKWSPQKGGKYLGESLEEGVPSSQCSNSNGRHIPFLVNSVKGLVIWELALRSHSFIIYL